MTKSDALEILLDGDFEYLEREKPAGITYEEVFEVAISIASSNELDRIASHLGLSRDGYNAQPFAGGVGIMGWFPETDEDFRKRITDYYIGSKGSPKGCQHIWVNYQGFTQTYDYCTICDEKRHS